MKFILISLVLLATLACGEFSTVQFQFATNITAPPSNVPQGVKITRSEQLSLYPQVAYRLANFTHWEGTNLLVTVAYEPALPYPSGIQVMISYMFGSFSQGAFQENVVSGKEYSFDVAYYSPLGRPADMVLINENNQTIRITSVNITLKFTYPLQNLYDSDNKVMAVTANMKRVIEPSQAVNGLARLWMDEGTAIKLQYNCSHKSRSSVDIFSKFTRWYNSPSVQEYELDDVMNGHPVYVDISSQFYNSPILLGLRNGHDNAKEITVSNVTLSIVGHRFIQISSSYFYPSGSSWYRPAPEPSFSSAGKWGGLSIMSWGTIGIAVGAGIIVCAIVATVVVCVARSKKRKSIDYAPVAVTVN